MRQRTNPKHKLTRLIFRVQALFLVGIVCSSAIWLPPARSQGVEKPAAEQVQPTPTAETTAPTTPATTAKPSEPKAITTKDPTISVKELQLLVKPLTVEELKIEAEAWLALLKENGKAISNAEIVIGRQNLAIDKQKETAGSLDEAKKALEEAEKAKSSAAPGSPESEAAGKKLQEAKEKLKKAQTSLKEVETSKKELQQDKTLTSTLKKAEETGKLEASQKTFEEAKTNRDKLTAGTPAYEAESKKLDKLEQAIKAFEKAQKDQREVDSKSPKFQEAEKELKNAEEALKKAEDEIKGVPSSSDNKQTKTEKSAEAVKDTTLVIINTEIKPDVKTEASPSDTQGQKNLSQKGQQLEKASEKLQQSAENEAEIKKKLVVNVTKLQSTQTAIVDRLNVVLTELEKKGGDVKAYRSYVDSITKAEIDVKDTEAFSVRVISWLSSEQGGMRWFWNIVKFIGIVIVSWIASLILAAILSRLMKMGGTSKLLRQFLLMLIRRGGIVAGILLALTALEVSLVPILTLLGGASFILAFALQSNLSNIASGLMIMVYKPFDVGDEVKIGDLWGFVDSISLPSTRIKGFNGRMITVPNNTVWGGMITNLTPGETRKISVMFNISFDEDLARVESILLECISSHPKVLEDPKPGTFLWEFGEYSASILVNGATNTSEYWDVYKEVMHSIHQRFKKEGIAFQVPRRELQITSYVGNNDNNSKFNPVTKEQ
jgi:small conductance mechanosensitive channel